MVRAIIIVSALIAFVASVSAVPAGSLIDIQAKKHIGTGNINLQGAGRELIDARQLTVHDVGQRIDVGHHHHHGLLGGLLKKREEPAGTLRIARAPGSKKSMNKKKATA